LFGVFHEESGAKLVVRLKTKDPIAPEHSGVAKEETLTLFTRRGEIPLELDYAQTFGMGASGAAMK
jgi:hypothetical protein